MRLSELEEEKQELKEYQELDKQKRCLEYGLHHKEQNEVSLELEALDASYRTENSGHSDKTALLKRSLDKLAALEDESKNLKRQLNELDKQKSQLEIEKTAEIKEISKLQMISAQSNKQKGILIQNEKEIAAEITDLEAKIKEKEASLKNILNEFDEACTTESEAKLKQAPRLTIDWQMQKLKGTRFTERLVAKMNFNRLLKETNGSKPNAIKSSKLLLSKKRPMKKQKSKSKCCKHRFLPKKKTLPPCWHQPTTERKSLVHWNPRLARLN